MCINARVIRVGTKAKWAWILEKPNPAYFGNGVVGTGFVLIFVDEPC